MSKKADKLRVKSKKADKLRVEKRLKMVKSPFLESQEDLKAKLDRENVNKSFQDSTGDGV